MTETGPPHHPDRPSGPPGTPSAGDFAARLADAERRLAVYDQFQKETLAVLSKAIATAQEIRSKAEAEAKAVLDRARLEAALVDEVIARLAPAYPDLAERLRALRSSLAPPLPAEESALRAEVEALRKRLEIYEDFEDTIQSVLTEALRAAHEIRTRSEESVSQAAERARADLRGLQDDLAKLRAERDTLSAIVEELRRARETMGAQRAEAETAAAELSSSLERLRAAIAAETATLEERRREREALEREVAALRQEAARGARPERGLPREAFERDLTEVREELARIQGGEREEAVREGLRRELGADIERLRAERAAMVRERDYQSEEVVRLRAERDAVAQQLLALREAFAATLQQVVRTVAQPPVAAPAAEVALPVTAPAPAAEAVPAAPQVTEQSEVRVLVSPVDSFSGLVDLERRLQGFGGIRTVYVRDFRGGVATLGCNVTKAMPLQDLADMLARELAASVERVADGVIELKIKEDAKGAIRATVG